MKVLISCARMFALFFALSVCESATANTLTANIADYNAAQVTVAGGVVTVPTGLATYSVTSGSLTVGSSIVVTLPPNFSFASTPSLSDTGTATFTLSSGGSGSQSATFLVATADLASGQSLSLDSFQVQGATALETLTPIANALPLTMQAIGTDASPLSVGAFASEPGVVAVFVGAIQFIDNTLPSFGRFYGTGTNDQLTAVMNAIAVSPQHVDAATNTVPVLSANGTANTLSPTDTYTLIVGGKWGGIATAFASTSSNCTLNPMPGSVNLTSYTLANLPLNQEMFGCVTASGTTQLQPNYAGFTATIAPGSSTDFLAATVDNEFPGEIAEFGAPLPPVLSKAFGQGTSASGGTTTLTFTMSNPNAPSGETGGYGGNSPAPLTGIAFSDPLPVGMTVASPNGLNGGCGGGTITAAAGSSSVSLSGATLDGGAQCTFSVNVTVTGLGSLVNTTSQVTSNEAVAPGAAAIAALSVFVPAPALGSASLVLLGLLIILLVASRLRKRQSRI